MQATYIIFQLFNNFKFSGCLYKVKKLTLFDTKFFITICDLVRMTDLFDVQIQACGNTETIYLGLYFVKHRVLV